MARSARLVVPGLPHLSVQRSLGRRAAFRGDGDRELYLRLLGELCGRHGVEVLAWCLLPDRVELVLVPGTAMALAAAVGGAHRRYALARNRAEGTGGRLFRGRFASCVLDELHLAAAVRRLELAPVRLGLARAPEAWAWSSAGFRLAARRRDPLVADGALRGLGGDWRVALAAGDGTADLRLAGCLRTGRPAGARGFVVRLERLTGRRLRRGRPGRPRLRAEGVTAPQREVK